MEKLGKSGKTQHYRKIVLFPMQDGRKLFIGEEADKRFGYTAAAPCYAARMIRKEIGDYIICPLFAIMYYNRTAADETDLFLKQHCFKAIDCTVAASRDLEKKSFASTVCQEY